MGAGQTIYIQKNSKKMNSQPINKKIHEIVEKLEIHDILIAGERSVFKASLKNSMVVFVYCEHMGIGAACHFRIFYQGISQTWLSKLCTLQKASGQELIDNMMRVLTSQYCINKGKLKAKVFEGAQDQRSTHILQVREYLNALGIEVIGEDSEVSLRRELYLFAGSGRARISTDPIKLHENNIKLNSIKSLETPRFPDVTRTTGVNHSLAKADVLSSQTLLCESTEVRPIITKKNHKVKIFIIDDSKTMRDLLSSIFQADPGLEVLGMAAHPIEADRKIKLLKPDIITLDIHMPEMDGVTYLCKLMAENPLPVVMITSLGVEDGDLVLKSLELGAIDYIQKPKFQELQNLGPIICEKIKIAAAVKPKSRKLNLNHTKPSLPKKRHQLKTSNNFIVMGASTGGTVAIKEVLIKLPADIPPILIVQHIPAFFSRTFAQRLDELCPFAVKEAEDWDEVLSGRVLIAPGGMHMHIESKNNGWIVRISDEEPVNRHKPSVDVLFESVVKHAGNKAVGVLLTGMGTDGAKGLLGLKNAGCQTIVQDEHSCVVFGMPKEAIRLDAATSIIPLELISEKIIKLSKKMQQLV